MWIVVILRRPSTHAPIRTGLGRRRAIDKVFTVTLSLAAREYSPWVCLSRVCFRFQRSSNCLLTIYYTDAGPLSFYRGHTNPDHTEPPAETCVMVSAIVNNSMSYVTESVI